MIGYDNLPEKICLEDYGGNYRAYIDAVYAVFERDFIRHKSTFGTHRLSLKYHPEFQRKGLYILSHDSQRRHWIGTRAESSQMWVPALDPPYYWEYRGLESKILASISPTFQQPSLYSSWNRGWYLLCHSWCTWNLCSIMDSLPFWIQASIKEKTERVWGMEKEWRCWHQYSGWTDRVDTGVHKKSKRLTCSAASVTPSTTWLMS